MVSPWISWRHCLGRRREVEGFHGGKGATIELFKGIRCEWVLFYGGGVSCMVMGMEVRDEGIGVKFMAGKLGGGI